MHRTSIGRGKRTPWTPRTMGLALLSTLLAGAPATGQEHERARWETPVVSGLDLDDAGERVAYVQVELAGPAPASRILVTTLDGWPGSEVGRGRMPGFRPGSTDLAFLASGTGGPELRIATLSGRERTRVALEGGISDYAWAPDGERIALAGPGPEGRTGLFVHDLTSGETRLLDTGPHAVHVDAFGGGGAFDWSPDGRRIAFAVQSRPGVEGAYTTDLFAVHPGSGEVSPLLERPGMDMRPRWSPDGERIAFATSFGEFDRFARHGLAVLELGTRRVRDAGGLDETFLGAPGEHLWIPKGGGILVPTARGVTTPLLRLDLGSAGVPGVERRVRRVETLVGLDGGTVATPRIDAAGRTLVYLASDAGTPWEIRVRDLATGRERLVGGPSPRAPTPRWEIVRWTNAWGDSLQGLFFHARSDDGDEPRPLVTWLHGGPDGRVTGAFDPAVPFPTISFDPLPLYGLLQRGYAVFMPNHRGSAGYPAAVRTSVAGRYPEILEEDVLSGIDVLVERGVADPDRLTLGGWASGGMAATQLLTRTDRFAAAVSGAGSTSLEAAYGDGDFVVQWHSLMGGPPWERRDAWDRASPLRNAERIGTPLLLLHGTADTLVPVDQSRYLETYLRGLGRSVRLELLDGVGHGIALPGPRTTSTRAVLEWFDRNPGG